MNAPGYPHPGYPQPTVAATNPNTLPTIFTTRPGVNQVAAGTEMHFGPAPMPTVCQSCNQQIVTRVLVRPSMKTHLFAIILCILCCPCMWLPYCIPWCQNVEHYCPNCNTYIGRHNMYE